MNPYKRHSLWIAGVVTLVLLSFAAGTSLACLQMGAQSATGAEECCLGHCRHAMTGETAAKCCESHQAKVSQVLPAAFPAKIAFLLAYTLHVSLILPVVLQGPEKSLVPLTTGERPPLPSPLYTLHCALLI